jgi:hypothetical protein
MVFMFLNGGGMRGGSLHHHLQGAPLVRAARTAPKYRFWAGTAGTDDFPAIQPVEEGGCSVAGEVYDVPLEVLMRHLLPAEPRELELGIIELDDGTASLAMVLRREFEGAEGLVDISDIGDWRAYQARRR